MSDHINFPDILDRIKGITYGDQPDLDGFDGLDTMWEVRRACESIASAARSLRAEADRWIADYLDGRSARMDDFLLRVKPARKLVVINPAIFWDWLGADAKEAFRPEQVRITSLRAIAERRGENPRAVCDSLIDYDLGDPTLEVVPITRAPKFAAGLQHGEIVERKTS